MLDRTIAHLYELFHRYRPSAPPKGCPCCVPKARSAALLAVSVRELTEAALTPYWSKAVSTWGSVNDLRYFVPRILELAANPGSSIDLPWFAEKLTQAGWVSWLPEEVAGIRAFFLALWRTRILFQDVDTDTLSELLETVGGVAEDDLTPYFASFMDLSLQQRSKLIAALPDAFRTSCTLSAPDLGFLEPRTEQRRQITAWLKAVELSDGISGGAA